MSSFQEETYRTIGRNVKKYRLASNISQEKLSEILDVNSKYLRKSGGISFFNA